MRTEIKLNLTLFLTFFIMILVAQTPSLFNYQAVVRDNAFHAIPNTAVAIRFQVYNQLVGGTIVYQEDFSTTTSGFGVVNLQIGKAPSLGDLKLLNWSSSSFFVNIQMGNGGTYTDISPNRTQLVSVPYALHASKADTALVLATGGIPPGSIMAWGGVTAPAGWLLCDGLSYNNVDYPNLSAAIGKNFGGTGSTFNVPDARGMFLRGVAGTSTVDPDKTTRVASNIGGNPGNNVGSKQTGEFKSHNHGGGNHSHTYNSSTNGGNSHSGTANDSSRKFLETINTSSSGTIIQTQGGSETRPVNLYVNYIIKY